MKYDIFISYANPDINIAENLRSELKSFGLEVWIYSEDRKLSDEIWTDIEKIINEVHIVIFIASKNMLTSEGQKREIDIVRSNNIKSMPVYLDGALPFEFPEVIRRINGIHMNSGSVKSTAYKMVKQFFPALISGDSSQHWKYPRPGDWLKISNMDPYIEGHLNLGDQLYFRSISPIGLFECYSPKVNGLFWISPENVEVANDDRIPENEVPYEYSVSGMINIQILGLDAWNAMKNKK